MNTSIFGIRLQSPFIVGSGPLSYNAEAMIRLHQAGAGAVVTKTIRLERARNPVNHMVRCGKQGLLNCEKWSDYDAGFWLDGELKKAADAGVVCIASVGHTLEESSQILDRLEKTGASMVELVSYDRKELVPMIRDAKKRVSIPVLCKLSPNVPDFLEMAKACMDAGADGFTACDSMGPALRIDIETGRPLLGGADGYGWLTGSMILPFIAQKICELRKICDLPIIGLGGVTKWQDGIELAMAGADYIGVCSALIMNGPEYLSTLKKGMEQYLSGHGFQSLKEICGKVHRHLPQPAETDFQMGFEKRRCSRCGFCIKTCAYEAREFNENWDMILDMERCRACGLCLTMCPVKAIFRQPQKI